MSIYLLREQGYSQNTSLNSSKCKFMLISRKRNMMTNPPTITISGNTLETVPTFKYSGLLLTSDLSWSRHIKGVCTKLSKENLGPIVPSILPTCWPTNSSPTIYILCTAPHGASMQHQYGTHTWEKIKTCLKAHRNSHVKWWLKHGTEAMMSSWIWLTCPLLPIERCSLNYVHCTKLYMTCLIFHLT